MKNLNRIAADLFNKIRGRFPTITLGDEDGNITNIPEDARYYDFSYVNNGQDLGKVSVSLDEQTGVVVIVSRDLVSGQEEDVQDGWYNFLKELRLFSKKRLLTFDVRDINKKQLNKKDYNFLAKNRSGDDQMTESKMYGTKNTSYQKIGNARLAIKHSTPITVETSSSRTQKIKSIYVESPDGERFKYPYKHLSGARAMARHVSEGGNAYDSFGKYISGLSEEISKLRKFNRYMSRSAVMAESLEGYTDIVKERISTVKKTIENLQKPNYYQETIASFETPMTEDVPDDIVENWIDQLTIKQFNEELQDIFPYIYNLVKEGTKTKSLNPEDILGEAEVGTVYMRFRERKTTDGEMYLTSFAGFANSPAELQMDIASRKFMKLSNRDDIIKAVKSVKDDKIFVGAKDMIVFVDNPAMAKKYEHLGEALDTLEKFGKKQGIHVAYKEKDSNNQGEKGSGKKRLPKGHAASADKKYKDAESEHTTYFSIGNKRLMQFLKTNAPQIMNSFRPNLKQFVMDQKQYRGFLKWVNSESVIEHFGEADIRVDDEKSFSQEKGRKFEGIKQKEHKTTIGEFIMSYFDKETGNFPKGETAVLTSVQKEYGDQYVKPSLKFVRELQGTAATHLANETDSSEHPETNNDAAEIASDDSGEKHNTLKQGEIQSYLSTPEASDLPVIVRWEANDYDYDIYVTDRDGNEIDITAMDEERFRQEIEAEMQNSTDDYGDQMMQWQNDNSMESSELGRIRSLSGL